MTFSREFFTKHEFCENWGQWKAYFAYRHKRNVALCSISFIQTVKIFGTAVSKIIWLTVSFEKIGAGNDNFSYGCKWHYIYVYTDILHGIIPSPPLLQHHSWFGWGMAPVHNDYHRTISGIGKVLLFHSPKTPCNFYFIFLRGKHSGKIVGQYQEFWTTDMVLWH